MKKSFYYIYHWALFGFTVFITMSILTFATIVMSSPVAGIPDSGMFSLYLDKILVNSWTSTDWVVKRSQKTDQIKMNTVWSLARWDSQKLVDAWWVLIVGNKLSIDSFRLTGWSIDNIVVSDSAGNASWTNKLSLLSTKSGYWYNTCPVVKSCWLKPNYPNAIFTAGSPIVHDQSWVKWATSCWYVCKSGFSGSDCSIPSVQYRSRWCNVADSTWSRTLGYDVSNIGWISPTASCGDTNLDGTVTNYPDGSIIQKGSSFVRCDSRSSTEVDITVPLADSYCPIQPPITPWCTVLQSNVQCSSVVWQYGIDANASSGTINIVSCNGIEKAEWICERPKTRGSCFQQYYTDGSCDWWQGRYYYVSLDPTCMSWQVNTDWVPWWLLYNNSWKVMEPNGRVLDSIIDSEWNEVWFSRNVFTILKSVSCIQRWLCVDDNSLLTWEATINPMLSNNTLAIPTWFCSARASGLNLTENQVGSIGNSYQQGSIDGNIFINAYTNVICKKNQDTWLGYLEITGTPTCTASIDTSTPINPARCTKTDGSQVNIGVSIVSTQWSNIATWACTPNWWQCTPWQWDNPCSQIPSP